jgi:hypothetical protein
MRVDFLAHYWVLPFAVVLDVDGRAATDRAARVADLAADRDALACGRDSTTTVM